jgi:hypothetical protein
MEPIMGDSKRRVVSGIVASLHLCAPSCRHVQILLSSELMWMQCYFFDSDIGNYHYGPGESLLKALRPEVANTDVLLKLLPKAIP